MRLVALPPRQVNGLEPRALDYSRFIILSGPRTGSNLLSQALASHPAITCFREIFNVTHDFVQFDSDGYDNFSREAFEERTRDPIGFLESRVFCPQPVDVTAVGFKFHYGQFWGFPGILERLAQDRNLRVIHLRRRNALRALISLKLARETGAFMAETRRAPLSTRLAFAWCHPARAAKRLRQTLPTRPAALRIEPTELSAFIVKTNQSARHYDKLFDAHPTLRVEYEDLARDKAGVVTQTFHFLGVRPVPPVTTLRKQHPEPLRDLIDNYEELRAAFERTPHHHLFDDEET